MSTLENGRSLEGSKSSSTTSTTPTRPNPISGPHRAIQGAARRRQRPRDLAAVARDPTFYSCHSLPVSLAILGIPASLPVCFRLRRYNIPLPTVSTIWARRDSLVSLAGNLTSQRRIPEFCVPLAQSIKIQNKARSTIARDHRGRRRPFACARPACWARQLCEVHT